MATKKKLLEAAAGSAGGAGLDVNEVFSTYLYTGNSSTQTITNGIDLAGEGGLVWTKNRDTAGYYHNWIDTERGISNWLRSDATSGNLNTYNNAITSFNSNGYSLGTDTYAYVNNNGKNYASWTFRKAPKFFDVVTYTGDGTAGRTVSHNLGSVPGCMIVKRTDTTGNWHVYHRGIDVNGDSAPETDQIYLNLTNAASDGIGYWNDTAPTSTEFTVGSNSGVNASGGTYVAYLFAHNNGDGDFGSTADQDIIKCGSYTGNGSTTGPEIDLGWEPQWVMIKNTNNGTRGWPILDTMRGWGVSVPNYWVLANESGAEGLANSTYTQIEPTSQGFRLTSGGSETNENGSTHIYIAIRRGPMAVPESATDVFAIDTAAGTSPTPPTFYSGFPVDFHFYKSSSATGDWNVFDRLRGDAAELNFNLTNAESSNAGTYYNQDLMDGVGTNTGVSSTAYQWMFRRAPSFMDVVAYTGNGVAGRTVSHNLGVVPEMMIVKNRDDPVYWAVYHKDLNGGVNPEDYYMRLNENTIPINRLFTWNDTPPTDTVFSIGIGSEVGNNTATKAIAYLFASLDGISKVGSYTGNGSTQTINCGFSSGARFVLIKRTDSTGDWYIWDTERGIVAANDPHLSLNTTAAQVTTDDSIDPVSSGFAVNQVAATNINVSSASYIYYAVS